MLILSRTSFFALLCLSLLCHAQASPEKIWPEKCGELKQKHLTDPVLQVTFSKKPVIQAKVTSWTLGWHGLLIPVPSSSYDVVAINRDAEGNYFVHLRDSKKSISLTLLQHPAMNETLLTGDSKMTLYELTMLGFEKTPADLKCQPGSWAREAPVADALIMKGIDIHGKLDAVYRESGPHPGWTLKIMDNDEISFRSFRQAGDENLLLEIMLTVPHDNAYRILGYQLGTQQEASAATKPTWLSALEKAVNSGASTDWQTFFQLAEKHGFDKEQLATSKNNLGL
jgi:hypothetical protein